MIYIVNKYYILSKKKKHVSGIKLVLKHIQSTWPHTVKLEIRGQLLGAVVFSFHYLGIKLRSLGIVASAFPCWVISLPLELLNKRKKNIKTFLLTSNRHSLLFLCCTRSIAQPCRKLCLWSCLGQLALEHNCVLMDSKQKGMILHTAPGPCTQVSLLS